MKKGKLIITALVALMTVGQLTGCGGNAEQKIEEVSKQEKYTDDTAYVEEETQDTVVEEEKTVVTEKNNYYSDSVYDYIIKYTDNYYTKEQLESMTNEEVGKLQTCSSILASLDDYYTIEQLETMKIEELEKLQSCLYIIENSDYTIDQLETMTAEEVTMLTKYVYIQTTDSSYTMEQLEAMTSDEIEKLLDYVYIIGRDSSYTVEQLENMTDEEVEELYSLAMDYDMTLYIAKLHTGQTDISLSLEEFKNMTEKERDHFEDYGEIADIPDTKSIGVGIEFALDSNAGAWVGSDSYSFYQTETDNLEDFLAENDWLNNLVSVKLNGEVIEGDFSSVPIAADDSISLMFR